MRLPSGYGGITKLSGNRRNPWRVRITAGWELDPENGKVKQICKTIGYYPTKKEAMNALSKYNMNGRCDFSDLTFGETYQQWAERKFEEISPSNVNGYKAAFKLCEPLQDVRFSELKLAQMQKIIDEAVKNGKKYPTLKKLKTLFNQMFDYAVQNEMISKDKHVVEYLNIGKPEKSEKHYRFSDEEIEKLWQNSGDEYVSVILMLIYSGIRPGELFDLKSKNVNTEEKYFRIEKGKNRNAIRNVPIHEKIFPFFEKWLNKNTEYLVTKRNGKKIDFAKNHGQYTQNYWKPQLKKIGALNYVNENGEMHEHAPHDTRHTFTTMWKEKQLNESVRRKIQGHGGTDVGENVYTHVSMKIMQTELNKL